MDSTATITLAAIGLAGTLIAGFFKLFDSQTKALRENSKALAHVAKASEKVATATTKSAKEAEKRNGHLAELALEGQKQNREFTEKVISTIQNVKHQTVVEQTVEHSETKE